MEIERGPVTEIEIVKQKLPASGSTPESFSVPRRVICLGMIVFSRTDIVSSGLLSSCRFAGVKNLKWMIRVTTRVIIAYGKSFSDAYLEAESLGFSYPVQGKHHTTSAKPKHTTSSPSLSEQYFKRHPIEAGEKYLPWSREVGRKIHEHLCSLQHSRDHRKRSRVGGRGLSWEFLVGVCRPALQMLTLFQTKNCQFSHPFLYPILDLA